MPQQARVIVAVAAEADDKSIWSRLKMLPELFAAGPVAIRVGFFGAEGTRSSRPFMDEAGFVEFANLVWSGYTLASPIGRLLDTTPIRYDRADTRLTDAIYDAGGRVIEPEDDEWRRAFGDYDGKRRPEPHSPIAVAVVAHWQHIRDERSSRRIRVPLRPDVLVETYARERVTILVEADKVLKGRVAKGLRAWRRLLGLLEAERGEIAA